MIKKRKTENGIDRLAYSFPLYLVFSERRIIKLAMTGKKMKNRLYSILIYSFRVTKKNEAV